MKTNLKLWKKTADKTEEAVQKQKKTLLESSMALSYRLIGDKIGRFMPVFKDLDTGITKAGLKANFKAYVSLTIVISLIVGVIFAVACPILLFALRMPLMIIVAVSFGAAMIAGAVTVIGFYSYPLYLADKHKREVEDELPFATGYMAILASAGVSPEKIFNSISTLNTPLAVSVEAKEIVRDVNLFGLDIISALEKTAKQTPSSMLKDTLEGIISTIHSGSSLSVYLRERFRRASSNKKLRLKKYADNLSLLSEVYVALFLTAPLLLAIMVSIMSVLGGGFGSLGPDLTLILLTYFVIPIGTVLFLLVLDMSSPKW
ncbi:MAG: type II secretion system F family protein [Candidatus Bathyarchaeota archaeon]|nr:type II secretion system F family protein [Candidatus Bathyarchaeota archaeon]